MAEQAQAQFGRQNKTEIIAKKENGSGHPDGWETTARAKGHSLRGQELR